MAEQRRNTRNTKSAKVQPVNDYGRIQPQAPELEEAVLGALMIEKDAYSLVSEILRPESFYEHRHQLIYAAITDLAVNQKPVDILTVKEQLSKRGDLEEVGGPFYITQLSSKVASSAHIEYHARIIAQKSLARELITFTSNIQSKAFDETLDVDDLMQEAEGKLFEISQQNMKKDYTQINPVIDEAYKLIQKAAARTDGLSGLESGFTKLDKMTSGWQNSDLIIIAARPAMGKTAFVLSMAKNIAVDYRNPVALFSLEMSNVQLVNRLIANVCEIPSEKIKSGQLANYEWQQLDYKLKNLMDAPVHVQKRNKEEVKKEAMELLEKMGLSDKADCYPCQLSGGQQQRVAIARALALHPQILFFDEPTSALDPELTGEILKVIRQLASEHMTMVIVTHEMAFARDVADRVIFMDGGYIIEQGDPKEVIEHPKEERTKQFLARFAQN